jgi:hypothetical protein
MVLSKNSKKILKGLRKLGKNLGIFRVILNRYLNF